MKKVVTKRLVSAVLASSMVLMAGCSSSNPEAESTTAAEPTTTTAAASASGTYTAGTYTGEGQGFGGAVTVAITVDADSITDVKIEGADETPNIGGAAFEDLAAQIKDAQSAEIDGVSGATLTSNGVKEAATMAIALAKGEEVSAGGGELTFTAGTYTGVGAGYNGDVSLDVTFSDSAITDIVVNTSAETNHVGTPAFDIMFPDAIEANGSGIDSVSGATFTSRAVKDALNDAAEQAGVSDLAAFKKNTVVHEAGEDIEVTYDVVVVGGGGAGMAAAAEAALSGKTVLIMEANAEIGGNTLVSGGAYQSVMPYLVWDPKDPDATTGTWEYNGESYDKVMSTQGCIDTLKTILKW